jgi:hypothetical protein
MSLEKLLGFFDQNKAGQGCQRQSLIGLLTLTHPWFSEARREICRGPQNFASFVLKGPSIQEMKHRGAGNEVLLGSL